MIKNITMELSDYIARIEEETIEKFMLITGKGNLYAFKDAGYTITKQQIKDGIDGIMLFRITLMRYNDEIIHQDIEIKINTTME